MATPEKNPVPAAPDMPGMPAGSQANEPLAAGSTPDSHSGHARPPVAVPFGGNVGRKTRADGLKPGSPEAIAADRARDAERKRREREKKRLETPPPTLPAVAPGGFDSAALPPPPETGFDAATVGDPVLLWSAEDFRSVASELVELAEAWRVDSHTKHAVKGNLPKPVVEEIGKAATFPPGSKKSLSNSSPATLAKMFNALKVPLAVKSVITTAPALAYIIVRDLQTSARIDKLIAESKKVEAEEKKPS